MSYWAFRHSHILHICYNFVCWISLKRTLCDAYYEEHESHYHAFLDIEKLGMGQVFAQKPLGYAGWNLDYPHLLTESKT